MKGLDSKRFGRLCKDAESFNEKNDCAVKAVAVATGRPYKKVREIMARRGRRPRGRTNFETTSGTLRDLGYDAVPLSGHRINRAKTVVTLERLLPSRGVFLIRVRGHILAARGGKVHDWTSGRRHRINEIYRVVKKK